MSQYFYAIRTSCHLLNLITGFTRGVITSWYQCRFVSCLWHSPCFITLPSALFWFFFCRCLFICHPGTSGTNTLGPGLPCLWLALLGAGSGPLQHRQGEGAECHSHPLPRIPLCRDAEFIAAISPVNLPSLLTLAPGNLGRPRTAQTHRRRQPVPPRQYYLPKPGGGRTRMLSASVYSHGTETEQPAESPGGGMRRALPVTPRASSLALGRTAMLCLRTPTTTGLPLSSICIPTGYRGGLFSLHQPWQ